MTESLPAEDLSRDPLLAGLSRDPQGRPTIGRIALLRRVGIGGMGAVYYAIHPRLSTEVAVKVLPPLVAERDPMMAERFISEARIAASLANDHVVRVLDVDVDGSLYFLVMEFVHGESAGAYAKRAGRPGLPEREAVEIVAAASNGLAAAHERGIIHRDIKPDNILIPRGDFARAKLADLGLAKPAFGGQSLGTLPSVAMGTPGYMAPEQVEDARLAGMPADVFAMGATMYALLSGRPPFVGTSLAAILRDTETKEPEPLPAAVAGPLRAIVQKCLQKEPGARFADGRALLAALAAVRGGAPEVTLAGIPSPDVDSYDAAMTEAEIARTAAEAKDSSESWQKVVVAATRAEASAPDEDLLREAKELSAASQQRRDWAGAREAERAGDALKAAMLAAKAVAAWPAPEALAQFHAELSARKRVIDERSTRKRQFDQWAATARAEKDPVAAMALWRHAEILADHGSDQHEARRRLADLAAEATRENRTRRVRNLLREADAAAAAGKLEEAAWKYREGLLLEPDDAAAKEGLARVEATIRRRGYDASIGAARDAVRKGDWAGVKSAADAALESSPGDSAASNLQRDAIKHVRPERIDLPLGGRRFSFIRVPAGTFTMGDVTGAADETPHEVTLTSDVWMQTTPVTQSQWEAVAGSNPSHFKGADRPVEHVSWSDVQEWITKFNPSAKEALAGWRARLPSEAEWERACRAGTPTRWCFGDDEARVGEAAWFAGNAGGETHPVALKRPNAWGLHDMHGNVWEWCQDRYAEYAAAPARDPAGPETGMYRVLRGGDWHAEAARTRSAVRRYSVGSFRYSVVGFRLALEATRG